MSPAFYVYFARGYANEELIGIFPSQEDAERCAREDFDNGTWDIEVYDEMGRVVFDPSREAQEEIW